VDPVQLSKVKLKRSEFPSSGHNWQGTWQICKRLGIMNHTQRHWRATQLAGAMDPFTLKEALHQATMQFEYVHRAESRRLESEEEAHKIGHNECVGCVRKHARPLCLGHSC